MNGFLLAAAITSFLTNMIHIFLGGKYVARPLLDANGLTKATKYTNYYCWHLVTITLFAIALAFYLAARPDGSIDLAYFAVGLSSLFCAWNLIMIVKFQLSPKYFPQWSFFLISAVLGFLGLG